MNGGINWHMLGMLAVSIACIVMSIMFTIGVSLRIKKIFAYTLLKAHPGFREGQTWFVHGHSTGSYPVLLESIGLNTVTLRGEKKTVNTPILLFVDEKKVTIDQESMGDEARLTNEEYKQLMKLAGMPLDD